MLKLVDTKCHCWLNGHRASATSLGVTNLRYVNDYVGSTVHALHNFNAHETLCGQAAVRRAYTQQRRSPVV